MEILLVQEVLVVGIWFEHIELNEKSITKQS
jgi:hypothetical protein